MTTKTLTVHFDNESDSERVSLTRDDLILMGVRPESVKDGNIATYRVSLRVTDEEVEEALDDHDWCHFGYSLEEDTGKDVEYA